ncbi:MAG: alpha-amylase family glycosyl hydrolase, partial [Brevefilum sp.]
MFEFHVSRLAREKYDFDETLFKFNGNVIFPNFLAARQFAEKINQKRDLVNYPEKAVQAGELNAIGLIDEILHLVISLYRKNIEAEIFQKAYQELIDSFGKKKVKQALKRFAEDFPPSVVHQGDISVEEYLEDSSDGIPNTSIALEEMMMLWITNKNPATENFLELFDDSDLIQATIYRQMVEALIEFFKRHPHFGPDDQDLYTMLRSPAVEEPYSLINQLEFIRRKWGSLLGDYLYRLLSSIDLIREETKQRFGGAGPSHAPSFENLGEEENFSPDSEWMPQTVMIAKNTYVWLYQLSEKYGREIEHLDQIPDEELDTLAGWGFNSLWLIGLWERSKASKRIKQLCGNPEAVASAYSLKDYTIAEDLGGEEAYQRLREKAWQRGMRLASDMVPNHIGIDSNWVLDHPDWFIS